MTIANNIVAKLGVAFVAVAMLFTLANPASAQTTEELQQMINNLLAQVATLQAQLGGGGSMAAGVCPYTWTRSLTVGDSGMDVMKLQQFLNSSADTRVAATGIGSAGQETEYYGALTGAAVAKFQEKYRTDILSPLGLVTATTYFGPSTMAKANALCVSAPAADDTADDVADDSDDSADDSDMGGKLGNDEGSIESVDEVSADESNLEEGQEGGVLAFEVTIEGDVEINRIDVYTAEAGSASEHADDYFVRAFLMLDGDEIAEIDVDDFDQDDYDVTGNSGDDYRLRFSSLDLVFEDGDEPEFQVGFEVVNNIDSGDITTDWDVELDSIRFVDGQGFTDTEEPAGIADSFGFDAEETAELDVTKSSDSPDGTTLEVDDNDTSESYDLLVFEIEEQNGVDVTIEDMTFLATTTNGDVTTTIDEVMLFVDGEEVDSDSPTAAGTTTFENLGIDVDGEGSVEVTVVVVFNGTDDYTEGDSVSISLVSIDDAEDANGNDESDMTINIGTVESDDFTLRSEGIEVNPGDHDFDTQGSDDTTGVFTVEFEVTAFGDDFYIAKNATNTDVSTDGGVNFTVTTSAGTPTSISGSLSSTADEDTTDVFTVNKGDTETFTLTVTVDASATGLHTVSLDDIWYSTTTDGVSNVSTDPANPATDYRVVDKNINQV